MFDNFEILQCEIENLAITLEEQFDVEMEEREAFQNYFFSAIGKAKRLIRSFRCQNRTKH